MLVNKSANPVKLEFGRPDIGKFLTETFNSPIEVFASVDETGRGSLGPMADRSVAGSRAGRPHRARQVCARWLTRRDAGAGDRVIVASNCCPIDDDGERYCVGTGVLRGIKQKLESLRIGSASTQNLSLVILCKPIWRNKIYTG